MNCYYINHIPEVKKGSFKISKKTIWSWGWSPAGAGAEIWICGSAEPEPEEICIVIQALLNYLLALKIKIF